MQSLKVFLLVAKQCAQCVYIIKHMAAGIASQALVLHVGTYTNKPNEHMNGWEKGVLKTSC